MNQQAGIEKAIIPYLVLEVLMQEVVMLKNRFIGPENHKGSIRLSSICFFMLLNQYASFEFGHFCTPIPEGGYHKIFTQRIDRLSPYPIQSHRFLKGFAVVLGAGI